MMSLNSDGSLDLDGGSGRSNAAAPPPASADLQRHSWDVRSSQTSLPSVDVDREVPLAALTVRRKPPLYGSLSLSEHGLLLSRVGKDVAMEMLEGGSGACCAMRPRLDLNLVRCNATRGPKRDKL